VTYPREWTASTDPAVQSGEAVYMVEGCKYHLRLDSFGDFIKIGNMLDAAFKSGKVFAAQAVRSHMQRALDDAEIKHELT
jgi:ATP-dependent protease HslVU (ClpYQ) peptidase subunit